MSFSMAAVYMNSIERINYVPFIITNPYKADEKCCSKKIVTLQVRILKKSKIFFFGCHGKEAFPSISFLREGRQLTASMTLEASLVLSLFIFASVSLLLPMKIMNTERQIQAALEAVGEDFSQYAYLQDMLERGNEKSVPGADDYSRGFCGNLAVGAATGYAQFQVMKYVDTKQVKGVNMLRTSIGENGELFDLVLDYEIQMPFPVLGIGGLKRTARCSRRAWVGVPGKVGTGDGSSNRDEGGGIVYVGQDSTRYHKDPSCHYLANQLTGVPFEKVGERRNGSGGKYHACSVCGPGKPGSKVFIMPEGSSYHTDTGCRAIVAYAQAVKLDSVKHLGPCSYCSR